MYPLTFYVKTLPPNVGGCANGPVIRILEKYRNDIGLHEHELLHVKQWAAWSILTIPLLYVLYSINRLDLAYLAVIPLSIHSFLYMIFPKYKLWAEVQAYKVQAAQYKDNRKPLFAEYISKNYSLNITKEQALVELNK